MIAYLKGKILKKFEKSLIIDTGNIGYLVYTCQIEKYREKEEIALFIHSHIREDSFDLYGFENEYELEFFKNLISINGIGPKSALDILSEPIDQIKNAILLEDLTYLKKLPGIGAKTAQRIILELKNKIEPPTEHFTISSREINSLEVHHAIEALINLGYNKKQIADTLSSAPSDHKKAEELITYFLKNA